MHLLQERNIHINQLKPGDIIHFFYEGKLRKVFVLNANWHGKLHALYVEDLPHYIVLRMADFIVLNPPYNLYHTYIKVQNLTVALRDIYRTFIVNKISQLKLVFYDLGYNESNPNTVVSIGKSLLLGMSDAEIFISKYPMFHNYIRWAAQDGMFVREPPLSPIVINFTSALKINPRFNSWRLPGITDEIQQSNYLNRLLSRSSIFFVDDTQWSDFNAPTAYIPAI